MKRLGLVIFILSLINIFMNIAIFGLDNSFNKLLIQILLNSFTLGIVVVYMINKNALISHIGFVILIYLIVFGKCTIDYNFMQSIKGYNNLKIEAIVENINYNDKYEYTLKVKTIDDEKFILDKKILVKSHYDYEFQIGNEISANLNIEKTENKYLYGKDVLGFGSFVTYEVVGNRFSIRGYSKYIQTKIVSIIEDSVGGYYGEVVSSFLVGEKLTNIKIKELLMVTGIYHFMAISGLHIGFIYAISKWLCDRLFYRVTSLKVTMLLIILYAFITGLSYSTIRATLMVCIVLLGNIINEKADGLNTVGVAGFIILLINPFAVYNISFIYSFTILLGILVSKNTVVYFLKTMFSLRYDKDNLFIEYIAVIITAQLYFIPISLYLFGKVYMYSLLVNMLTGFIIPVLFVIALLIVIFYGSIINIAVSEVAKFLIDYILLLSSWFERLPYSMVYIGKPKLFYVIICYIALVGISYYATKNIYEVNYGKFGEKSIFVEE